MVKVILRIALKPPYQTENCGLRPTPLQSVLMRSGRDKDQLVFKKWLGLDLAVSRWTLDEAQCDFLLLHGLHNVLRVAANQSGMNTGMLSTKLP